MLKDKVKCPLCSEGFGTIEIDGFNDEGSEVDYHCTKCNIWVKVNKVTQEEKAEMFNW